MTFTETVPVLDDRGHMTAQDVDRTCEVDIAVRWGTGYDTTTEQGLRDDLYRLMETMPAALVRPEEVIETTFALADQGLRVTRRLALVVTQSVRSLVTA